MRYNAVNFTFDDNVVLTKVGFFTSNAGDLLYDLFILEVKSEGELEMIYNEKKIEVKKKEDEHDKIIREVEINELYLKADKTYQIRQNLVGSVTSHLFGYGEVNPVVTKSAFVTMKWSLCEFPSKTNSTISNEGLIPDLYFKIDTSGRDN